MRRKACWPYLSESVSKAKDKSKRNYALNPREGRYILDSGGEPSVKTEGFHWVLSIWLELREMKGNRSNRLQRANVWIEEMNI